MENIYVWEIVKAEETMLQERKLHMEDHRKVLQGNVAELTAKMKKLKMDCQMKANRAQAEGAIVLELKNQFEEFRLKYDRLFDYNQTLRNQMQSISHEVQKIDESNGWSNLKSKLGFPTLENNGKGVDFENATETATECGEHPFSATYSSSSPRHRRPIYQC
ncbi:b-cell receptor-associated protein [Datura stramonium]|uniref:Endoplasmic reticulum transmembrane protein n=1 Tax=Datura stramonium TaxID=4076 RepID=A0ABS8RFZ6_DATST|nr:b-cell receptor-associated protein [Datura stramonium]